MSLLEVSSVVDNWVECRKRTTFLLRHSAEVLRSSHQENAEVEHESATVSLVGDIIGLSGILLAPVSGGASLALFGFSSLAGLGSYLNKRDANKKDESIKQKVDKDVEQAIGDDRSATAQLNEILQHFSDLEYKLETMQIGDILISLAETSMSSLNISAREIESSRLYDRLQNNDSSITIPGLGISKHVANLKAAVTSAEEAVNFTKEVCRGARTIREVVSTAKSVNKISQTAKSLSNAKQAAVLSLHATQSVTKSSTAFVSISKGTDGVRKTVGVVSSAAKSGEIAAKVVTASGQATSTAKTVTKVVKAGKAISTASKGAATTIKTVKKVKEASNTVKTVTKVATDTDKAIRTTRITTKAAKVTKISKTATKAASISKVGLVLNVVVIPLDIYNLVVASDNLSKSHEDVERIETEASNMEKEMEKLQIEFDVQVENFKKLHYQLYKVYENHRIELIYEYLESMHEKLDLSLPWRYKLLTEKYTLKTNIRTLNILYVDIFLIFQFFMFITNQTFIIRV